MSTKWSQWLTITRQVLRAPVASMVQVTRRVEREGGENAIAFSITSLKWCVNGTVSIGLCLGSSNANDRIIKATDELWNFVSKTSKNILKWRSIECYFKKRWTIMQVWQTELVCSWASMTHYRSNSTSYTDLHNNTLTRECDTHMTNLKWHRGENISEWW